MELEEIMKSLEGELGITLNRVQIENLSELDLSYENEIRIFNGKMVSLRIFDLAISILPKSFNALVDLILPRIDNCVNYQLI